MAEYGFNKDGYELQGFLIFQGFHIEIENRAGDRRYWTDHVTGETGYTTMMYPYGYITSTLGTDDDEVDVYVGHNEHAENVYIIDQMSKPDFKKFDEQKVMMGFRSEAEAKQAYLYHYNNPGFFGGLRTMRVEEFRAKLNSTRGEIIKSRLKMLTSSDRIRGNMPSIVQYQASSITNINPTSLTPAQAFALRKSGLDQEFVTAQKAYVAKPEGLGTTRVAPLHENPVVPTRSMTKPFGE